MNILYFSYLLSIMYICTFMRINIVIVIVSHDKRIIKWSI